MKTSNIYYQKMETNHIGDAFCKWWQQVNGNNVDVSIVSWYYGMTILGDPTINFRYKVSDVCSTNLTLSSYPSDNNSNLIMFKAEQSITVNSGFVIPSGVHVIFDAPQIYFSPGFSCQSGASFETRSEGCQL